MSISQESGESEYHDEISPLALVGPSSSSSSALATINDSNYFYNLNNFLDYNDNHHQTFNLNHLLNSNSVFDLYPKITYNLPIICAKPVRVGYFSVHVHPGIGIDTYHPDFSSLTYLKPNYTDFIDMNLFRGYPDQTEYFLKPKDIDYILQWASFPYNRPICSDAHFICTSAKILRSMLNVPHNNKIQWSTLAIKFGSTIVLTLRDSNTCVYRSSNDPKIKATYSGYRFCDMVTLKSDDSVSRFHLGCNRESFYMVNKFQAGPHKIIYPTRIDCLIGKSQYGKPIRSMKTAQIHNRYYLDNIKSKSAPFDVKQSIDWWSGAFLAGSEKIVCGDKTRSGQLKDIKILEAKSLINVKCENLPEWSPRLCVEHLNYILDVIWNNVREEETVYKFRWSRKNQRLEYSRLSDSFLSHIINRPSNQF